MLRGESPHHAEQRIRLIDGAVGFDACMRLGYAVTAEDAGIPAVSRARIYFHGASFLAAKG